MAAEKNPISKQYKSGIKSITKANNKETRGILITNNSTVILIQEKHPAYSDLSQCDIALTTVGANTAELGLIKYSDDSCCTYTTYFSYGSMGWFYRFNS